MIEVSATTKRALNTAVVKWTTIAQNGIYGAGGNECDLCKMFNHYFDGYGRLTKHEFYRMMHACDGPLTDKDEKCD